MSARTTFRARPRPTAQPGFLGRLLDPIDRLAETIFSILILLTFTMAFRIIKLGLNPLEPIPPDYTRDLALAAFGAIVAWGLIDGVMYALLAVFERGEKHRLLARLQFADGEAERLEAVAEEFDYVLAPITHAEQRRALYADVVDHLRESKPQPVNFMGEDVAGALGCLLVAVVAVLPSLVPLVLLPNNYGLAVRLSNVISFSVLFYAGYQWGRHTGSSPWKTGLLLAAIGAVLVLIAVALGG